jgi:polysaccharide export outer membrane protein
MTRCLLFSAAVLLTAPSMAFAQAQAAPAPAAVGVPSDAPAAAKVAKERTPAREFRIGPEDVLDISVWKNPELSRTVPVRPDGMVSLPLLNDVMVSGLTASELREELTKRLTEYMRSTEIAVSVIVREIHSQKVSITGSVKSAGRYELKSAATVLDVIALAQGFTDFAARDRIVVLRQNGTETTRIPFNYNKVAKGDAQANFLVQPGDIIVVP